MLCLMCCLAVNKYPTPTPTPLFPVQTFPQLILRNAENEGCSSAILTVLKHPVMFLSHFYGLVGR